MVDTFGSDEQRAKYVPAMASMETMGRCVCAACMYGVL